MKKLILVTRFFPPTNIVGAIRPSRVAKHALAAGWHVHVVHGPHDFREISERDTVLTSDRLEQQQIGLPRTLGGRRSILSRILGRVESSAVKLLGTDEDWRLARLGAAAIELNLNLPARQNCPTVLITSSPPHSIHSAGLTARRKQKFPWIVDLRDPWDKYVETGRYNQPNPLTRRREQAVMEAANFIVSSTCGYTEILQHRFPDVDPGKFVTITNSFSSVELTDPPAVSPARLTIAYTGIFYPEKDPYTFFRAVAHWRKHATPDREQLIKKHFRLQLVGVEDSVTPRVIDQLGLKDITEFVARVPQESALRICQAADFLLLAPGLSGKSRTGWLPSKVFEYLRCRKPIIAVCKPGELSELIAATDSGHLFHGEDPTPITSLLDDALSRKLSGEPLGERLSFTGIEAYSEQRMAKQFLALADRMIQTPSSNE